jgi:hypothetical protein
MTKRFLTREFPAPMRIPSREFPTVRLSAEPVDFTPQEQVQKGRWAEMFSWTRQPR